MILTDYTGKTVPTVDSVYKLNCSNSLYNLKISSYIAIPITVIINVEFCKDPSLVDRPSWHWVVLILVVLSLSLLYLHLLEEAGCVPYCTVPVNTQSASELSAIVQLSLQETAP